jgi:hypothetical protein
LALRLFDDRVAVAVGGVMVPHETYFLQRAKVEADAASMSSNAEARKAHLELSARYEQTFEARHVLNGPELL